MSWLMILVLTACSWLVLPTLSGLVEGAPAITWTQGLVMPALLFVLLLPLRWLRRQREEPSAYFFGACWYSFVPWLVYAGVGYLVNIAATGRNCLTPITVPCLGLGIWLMTIAMLKQRKRGLRSRKCLELQLRMT